MKSLPNMLSEGPMPHVLIADEAFQLRNELMWPYQRLESSVPRQESILTSG